MEKKKEQRRGNNLTTVTQRECGHNITTVNNTLNFFLVRYLPGANPLTFDHTESVMLFLKGTTFSLYRNG